MLVFSNLMVLSPSLSVFLLISIVQLSSYTDSGIIDVKTHLINNENAAIKDDK